MSGKKYKCSTCKKFLVAKNFPKAVNAKYRDYLDYNCRKCRKARRAAYIKINTTNYDQKVKREVYKELGNKCSCCGITTFKFLTIDHINPEDTKEDKKLSRGCGTSSAAGAARTCRRSCRRPG